MPNQHELTFLTLTDEVGPDCGTRVAIAGREPVAVFRLGEEFFAIADTCTHGAASLSEGDINDGQVECPFHSGSFDIRTGQPTALPCSKPLAVYPIVIENGRIYARLDDDHDGVGQAPCSRHAPAAQ